MKKTLQERIDDYQARKANPKRKSQKKTVKPAQPATGENASNLDKMYTVKQVKNLLHMSDETVYKQIRSGELGYIKISERRYIISESDLKEYLDAHRHHAIVA